MSWLREKVPVRGQLPPRLPPEFVRAPDTATSRRGLTQCLSNGKSERNIGECAGSGVLSHFPAERLGVELEFEQPSSVIERLRTERADQTAAVRLGRKGRKRDSGFWRA
jgi:hypothetical protein